VFFFSFLLRETCRFRKCMSVINVYTRNSFSSLNVNSKLWMLAYCHLIGQTVSASHWTDVINSFISFIYFVRSYVLAGESEYNYKNRLYHRLKKLCSLKVPIG